MRRLFSLSLAILLTNNTAFADSISGKANIIDGDTIRIKNERIRLHGIDAPEANQLCSKEYGGFNSAKALSNIIGKNEVQCETNGRDRYNRHIATCFAGGKDIGKEMVKGGDAFPYTKYSYRYFLSGVTARMKGGDVYRHNCVSPETHRSRNNG